MIFINSVDDVKEQFISLFEDSEITDGMIEINGVLFIADKPAFFSDVDLRTIEDKIIWHKSQSLDINTINSDIGLQEYANNRGMVNTNYGFCIFSSWNNNQYKNVLYELSKNENTQQAIMIYTRPTIWNDYNRSGINDFTSINTVQYKIKDNVINCYVSMRSMDIGQQYQFELAWQKYVLCELVTDLSSKGKNYLIGDVHFFVGSLYVKSVDFHYLSLGNGVYER